MYLKINHIPQKSESQKCYFWENYDQTTTTYEQAKNIFLDLSRHFILVRGTTKHFRRHLENVKKLD